MAEKTNWTAEMKALSADIETALRASPIKPSKAETLQTVAEAMQASGLSARQVLAATYEALGRLKTKLSPSAKKPDHPFADRLSEAKASARTEKASKAKEESKKQSEEFRQKWAESAAKLPTVDVSSDFAPHKIRRRLTIPLRDAKHAALRQIRKSVIAAFRTGAKRVWMKDERLESLEQSIKDNAFPLESP